MTASTSASDSSVAVKDSSALRQLCQRCDDVLLQVLSLIEQRRSLQQQCHHHLAEGQFAFAQVRHSHPQLPLDCSQYTERQMNATTSFAVEKSGDRVEFRRTRVSNKDQENRADDRESQSSSSIRRRVFNAHQSQRVQQLDRLIATQRLCEEEREIKLKQAEDADKRQCEDSLAPVVDFSREPLKWFSPLVIPSSLVQAQREFSTALASIVQVVSLNCRIRHLQGEFQELLSEKQRLLKTHSVNENKG